jgi:hypothetical protein
MIRRSRWEILKALCLAWAFVWGMVPFALAAGESGVDFLKSGAGARGTAMGDAQAAISEGALAAFWNPAGLGGLSSIDVNVSHNNGIEDVTDQRVAVAVPTKGAGTLAVGYQRLSVGDYLGFDAEGGRRDDLSSSDDVFSLSWGKNLVPTSSGGGGLFAGVGGKAISEEVAGVRGKAFAADFGFLARPWGGAVQRSPWLGGLSFGAAVRNLGSGIKFDSETTPLPTEYVGGLGYSLPLAGDLLTLAIDAHQVAADGFSISAGTEYWLKGLMALRVGYRTTDTEGAGLRGGVGFRLRQVQVDYAWSAMGKDLGNGHRFSLGYRFGPVSVAPGAVADLHGDLIQQGRRHMELGLYDRAILDFNEALKIAPNDEETRRLLLECGKKMEGSDVR